MTAQTRAAANCRRVAVAVAAASTPSATATSSTTKTATASSTNSSFPGFVNNPTQAQWAAIDAKLGIVFNNSFSSTPSATVVTTVCTPPPKVSQQAIGSGRPTLGGGTAQKGQRAARRPSKPKAMRGR